MLACLKICIIIFKVKNICAAYFFVRNCDAFKDTLMNRKFKTNYIIYLKYSILLRDFDTNPL